MRKSILIGAGAVLLIVIGSCKKEPPQKTSVQCQKLVVVPCTTATVTDIDGNIYNTVKVGTQCWMVQNLKTTHFRNGAVITEIEDSATWANIYNSSLTTPAWCYSDGNATTNSACGKLYNWYAATDPRQLCPTGWHVISDSDWTTLNNYLNVNPSQALLVLLSSTYTCYDNSYGPTPRPTMRFQRGDFDRTLNYTAFWLSVVYPNDSAGDVLVEGGVQVASYKADGFSVRCVGN